jgi:hypothetical protein
MITIIKYIVVTSSLILSISAIPYFFITENNCDNQLIIISIPVVSTIICGTFLLLI